MPRNVGRNTAEYRYDACHGQLVEDLRSRQDTLRCFALQILYGTYNTKKRNIPTMGLRACVAVLHHHNLFTVAGEFMNKWTEHGVATSATITV
jgi:hypothetical protein